MNITKKLKSSFLVFTLCAGMADHKPADARFSFDMTCQGDDLLWGIGIAAGVTVIGCGIAAACGAFTWSDEDIITWIGDGLANCDIRYQQLNQYSGSPIARLQLFGNRNKASWSSCKTEAEEVTYNNPALAPLHNALLVIHGDIKELHEFLSYLIKRNLSGHPRCRTFHTKISDMIRNLEQLKDIILSSPDYTHEEQVLQKKIHQLRQERLDRERNEALMHQANAQYRQARELREQTQLASQPKETNIIIVTEQESEWDRAEKARLEREAQRASIERDRAEKRAREERDQRKRAEQEAERLRRDAERRRAREQRAEAEELDERSRESDPFNTATYLDY